MLLFPAISNRCRKHLDASFKDFTSLSQIRNDHGPLSRLRLGFLRFFKGPLLLNFVVEHEVLVTDFRQLSYIFRIVLTILELGLMYWVCDQKS